MTTVGIISDTHSFIDDKVLNFLSPCDIVLHAGDIGNISLLDRLRESFKVVAVYGNIDDAAVRLECPKYVSLDIDGVSLLMTHIGGYPRSYNSEAEGKIRELKPRIFISGHSHILKVMNDIDYNLLHINPGAAGKSGFHYVRTAIRLKVDKGDIIDLEVGEWKR